MATKQGARSPGLPAAPAPAPARCPLRLGKPICAGIMEDILYLDVIMSLPSPTASLTLAPGSLRRVHHIALNVRDLQASRHFYGTILGLQELTGDAVPETLVELVAAGKIANFVTPDGLVLDLFYEPDLAPPHPDPTHPFTRANHLAFDIAPEMFDQAVQVLRAHQVPIDHGPVSRPTGRGIYCYDPDGLMVEIRCDRP